MKNTRRNFSSAFKTKFVLEGIKERYTLSGLAQQFDLMKSYESPPIPTFFKKTVNFEEKPVRRRKTSSKS